jgi:hypothetical protein
MTTKNIVISVLVAVVLVLLGILAFTYPKNLPRPIGDTDQTSTPMSPTDYSSADWKLWHDEEFSKASGKYLAYAFSYPRDFDVRTGDQAVGGTIGETKVQVLFPEDAFQTPQSNYAEGFFTVSEAATRAATCYVSPFGTALTDMETINGLTYKTGTTTDAGAGNLYTSRLYRTMFDNRCFEAALTVHTTNIGNYDPGTVVEFDKERAFTVLDKILRSFKLSTSTMPELQ